MRPRFTASDYITLVALLWLLAVFINLTLMAMEG